MIRTPLYDCHVLGWQPAAQPVGQAHEQPPILPTLNDNLCALVHNEDRRLGGLGTTACRPFLDKHDRLGERQLPLQAGPGKDTSPHHPDTQADDDDPGRQARTSPQAPAGGDEQSDFWPLILF